MSQKIEYIQLENMIKDVAEKMNTPELDNNTINEFAENIFNNNPVLAEQIVTGNIDVRELQDQLNNLITHVAASVSSMEDAEPFWDEEKPTIEPFWDDDK